MRKLTAGVLGGVSLAVGAATVRKARRRRANRNESATSDVNVRSELAEVQTHATAAAQHARGAGTLAADSVRRKVQN